MIISLVHEGIVVYIIYRSWQNPYIGFLTYEVKFILVGSTVEAPKIVPTPVIQP